MTPAELAGWEEVNAITGKPAARPCVDCSRTLAREMRDERRCNGVQTDDREGRNRR